ncbi:hypothetical protein [Actinomycetospora lemnae]|uniref:Uncharacterized protein n=1 Tax=Actinomycetospora lemnae TaxID=3019891 RepID=A0ABT5SRD4_9PSEU|nr:hypothetical protein [Actinomycetospora sp. DW7H6]MDD7965411.1 hypothetical protein [Actinomycetospora sp. DW7H6]
MFEEALREGVERAQDGLRRARREDLPYEATAHAARLLDLLDRAHDAGIDTTSWVDPELVTAAQALAGDL